jgi:hypothetical protein
MLTISSLMFFKEYVPIHNGVVSRSRWEKAVLGSFVCMIILVLFWRRSTLFISACINIFFRLPNECHYSLWNSMGCASISCKVVSSIGPKGCKNRNQESRSFNTCSSIIKIYTSSGFSLGSSYTYIFYYSYPSFS